MSQTETFLSVQLKWQWPSGWWATKRQVSTTNFPSSSHLAGKTFFKMHKTNIILSEFCHKSVLYFKNRAWGQSVTQKGVEGVKTEKETEKWAGSSQISMALYGMFSLHESLLLGTIEALVTLTCQDNWGSCFSKLLLVNQPEAGLCNKWAPFCSLSGWREIFTQITTESMLAPE